MRIGVLDIGSNTGHLLVVDAFHGGPPLPAHSYKEPLRLAEHLDSDGAVARAGIDALVKFVANAKSEAGEQGCVEIVAFATSAVREASNSDDVLSEVERKTDVTLEVLPGEEEARLTFLAVRRWFGWSSGRLGVFDIGGGSLEIAVGPDEVPEKALSLPLGAGRLTRDWLDAGRPIEELRLHIRAEIAHLAGPLLRGGSFDHAVATSKTFRSLARMCGAAPSDQGPRVKRVIPRAKLSALIGDLNGLSVDEIAQLPGVSSNRAHQMVAGAAIAEATMALFGVEELEMCPWALREGVLLERIDQY